MKKGAIFDLLFTFFSYQDREKLQKFLQHISHSHTCIFAHPIDFFALPILQKIRIYQVWFLFGVIPGVDFCARHILEQSINNKMVSKIKVGMSTTDICIYTNAKSVVICKPRTLNDGGEDSVQHRNRKKHCFLAAAMSYQICLTIAYSEIKK